MKKLTLGSLLTTLGFVLSVALAPATISYAAGSASYTLSPSGGSYNINSTLSVGVYENGTSVNVATANLSYNSSQLQFDSISPASGTFGGDVSSTGGSGVVSISRYVTPAGSTATGNVEIAVIDFTVLAGTGSTTIDFTSSSMIENAGTNVWDGVDNNATYNLTTPSPVITTPPTNTGSGSSSSASNPSKQSTPTTTRGVTTPAPTKSSTPTSINNSQNASQKNLKTSLKKTSNNSKKSTKTIAARTTADKYSYAGLFLLLAAFAVYLGYITQRRQLATVKKEDKR
jgi:hypothetical protein